MLFYFCRGLPTLPLAVSCLAPPVSVLAACFWNTGCDSLPAPMHLPVQPGDGALLSRGALAVQALREHTRRARERPSARHAQLERFPTLLLVLEWPPASSAQL